jgi:predicted acylesterase/phospholipase RssA
MRWMYNLTAYSVITRVRTDEELHDICFNRSVQEKLRYDFLEFVPLQSPVAVTIQNLMPESIRWLSYFILRLVFDRKFLQLDTDHLIEVWVTWVSRDLSFKTLGVWLRVLQTVVADVGQWTFQEAFDRTGRIINITVAPMNRYDPPRLLNYLTAPHVCIWSAVIASCAIPGKLQVNDSLLCKLTTLTCC